MEQALIYITYIVAAAGAVAIYAAMPRDGMPPRRAFFLPMLGIAIGAMVLLLTKLAGSTGQDISIGILSILALGGAVRVITHPEPVYSALYFILVVLSTAAMMATVGAEFLAAGLVIVYAGAILVTYVFVIMLAHQSHLGTANQFSARLDYDLNSREPFAAVAAGFVLVATVAGVILGHEWDTGRALPASGVTGGNTLAIGRVLLTEFSVSVELAGVLLMVAMIGAIALARRNPPHADGQPAPTPGMAGRHVKPF